MVPVSEAPASFEFGRFRILPQRREVLADGRPIELGGRAFDVLVVLIEASGAVVSKNELMSRVSPGRIVEDNNLHAQIRCCARLSRTTPYSDYRRSRLPVQWRSSRALFQPERGGGAEEWRRKFLVRTVAHRPARDAKVNPSEEECSQSQ